MKDLQKEADRLFSLLVRQHNSEDGLIFCCTCKKQMPWRESHCGHFMSRRHISTRYEFKNTAPQCTGCNTYQFGRQFEFGLYLDAKYGKGTAEEMLSKSNQTVKKTQADYQILIDWLKKTLKENGYQIR